MNYEQLRNALAIQSGKVVFSGATLTPNINDLLARANGGQAIEITSAGPSPGDGQDQVVAVQGRATFLNVPDLPVELQARVDSDGKVQAVLRFKLLGAQPSPTDWRFSRSFPQLPSVVDWNGTTAQSRYIHLDNLLLFDSYYVLTSQKATDPQYSVELEPGINFVGMMRPTGLVGLLESVFGRSEPTVIYGTIHLPRPEDSFLPLKPLQYPWDLDAPVPGVLLRTRLSLSAPVQSMKLQDVELRVYTPIEQRWFNVNPTYRPWCAYAGTLSVPSANLSASVTVPIVPGGNELMLLANFQGASLGNLAHLLDLSGSGSLMESMPEQIRQVSSALGKLQLVSAGLALVASPSRFGITWASISVGMPDLRWHVWKDHFVIDSIVCRFDVTDPFRKPELNIILQGAFEIEGVPLNIWASRSGGYTVFAELASKQTIPLGKLAATYAPGLPVPAQLTINTLRVSVAAFKSYSMAMAMGQGESGWQIDVGYQKLTVSDVVLAFSYPPLSGSFGGTVAFGNVAKLSLRYDVPGNFAVRGTFPEVSLSSLRAALCNQPVSLPGGFDLAFKNTYVLIQKSGNDYLFQVGTELEGVGTFAFEARKVSAAQNQWGFAAGLSLSTGKASSLQGLGALSHFEDFFGLQKLLLVVSSYKADSFTFPDLAAFNAPQLSGTTGLTLPSQAGGLIAGLNFYGEWAINTADKKQKLLRQFLGLNPTLGITLQVGLNPAQDARLYVSYRTKIQGHDLSCKFGGQLVDGRVGLFLIGSMSVSIQGSLQTFSVELLFVENGAFLSATMKGSQPIDFGVFKLGNLALAVGINWEGIPSLGVAGSISGGGFESSVAVFFNANDPSQSMVAGSLSDLTLKDVLDTLTGHALPSEVDEVLEQVAIKGTQEFRIPGELASALDNLKMDQVSAAFSTHGMVRIPSSLEQVFLVVDTQGSRWFLTDLTDKARHYQLKKVDQDIVVSVEAQLYCAPQRTAIGALQFEQGFYLNCAIEVLGFHASATVEISANKGIAIDGKMSKVVIGNETLFSISSADGSTGPVISAATFSRPELKVEEFRPPHFYVSGRLSMLGLSRSVYVKLTKSGFVLELKGDLLPLVYFDVRGEISGLMEMGLRGQLKVGIGTIDLGPLGKIDIKTGANGKLELGVHGAALSASFAAGFEFAGQGFSLPTLALDVKGESLKHLPEAIFNAVKDLLLGLFTDPQKWAEYVTKGFVAGVADVASVLMTHFGLSAADAQKVLDAVKKVCSVTTAALHL